MNDLKLNDNRLPIYNIKAVARLTGLLPVTLRAWERRYGMPVPKRGSQGYRLYSEYDIRILRWLKQQIDTGMSISRAVDYLNELRSQDQDPAAIAEKQEAVNPSSPAFENLTEELKNALVSFNENAASEVLRRAMNLHPLDQMMTQLIQPCMVELGESWHRGELAIAVEHFASHFVTQYLMTLMSSYANPTHQDVIIAACAPGETHQIGLLMLSTLLRWRGWNVVYLGADLSLENLETALRPLHPRMLLFSATRPQNAMNMQGLVNMLQGFHKPHPIVVLGGQGFRDYQLESLPATYLEVPVNQAVKKIEGILLNS